MCEHKAVIGTTKGDFCNFCGIPVNYEYDTPTREDEEMTEGDRRYDENRDAEGVEEESSLLPNTTAALRKFIEMGENGRNITKDMLAKEN